MNVLQISYWWRGHLGCCSAPQPRCARGCFCCFDLVSTLYWEEPTQLPQGAEGPPRPYLAPARALERGTCHLGLANKHPPLRWAAPWPLSCPVSAGWRRGALPGGAKAASSWPTESKLQGCGLHTPGSKTQQVPRPLCLLNKSRQWMAEKIRIILLISFSEFCHLHRNELQTFVAALPDSPEIVPVCSVSGGSDRFLAFLLMLIRSMHALLTRLWLNTNSACIPSISPCMLSFSPFLLPYPVTRCFRQKARAL